MQFISNNIFPIGMAIFSGIMLLWSYFGNRFKGVKEVNSFLLESTPVLNELRFRGYLPDGTSVSYVVLCAG